MTRTARHILDKAMDEDSLLSAVTEALSLLGYVWQHPRRTDRSVLMGDAGLPDVIAARNGIVWFLELKSAGGVQSPEQWRWENELPRDSHSCRFRLVRPADLDGLLVDLANAR